MYSRSMSCTSGRLHIWNTFKVTDKSGATVDAGKYLTPAARKDGKWRIIRDIWNSDNPPGATGGRGLGELNP